MSAASVPEAVGSAPIMEVRDLCAGYGDIRVLHEVGLAVQPGSVTALLGPNGAGKTTLLRAIAGLIRPQRGSVLVNGEEVTRLRPDRRARRGVCLIPEGRGVFPSLTVAENLKLATPPWASDTSRDRALDAFPILKERLSQRAGTMSGGQQQMLALSRCFLSEPSIVLLDEVSIGLAPRVVEEIFVALQRLADAGLALLLVEQYVHRALEMADAVHLINRGRLTFSGRPSEITEDSLVDGYLGASVDTAAAATRSAQSM